MKAAHFLKKLKNSSISQQCTKCRATRYQTTKLEPARYLSELWQFWPLQMLLLSCLYLSACGSETINSHSVRPRVTGEYSSTVSAKVASAPWDAEIGSGPQPGALSAGDQSVSRGDLTAAAEQYRQAQTALLAAGDDAGAELATARRAGTLLKLSRSKEALNEVSSFFAKRGIPIDSARTEIALTIAFAYMHEAQLDQTLAWFGVAVKNAPNERSAHYVRGEAKKLIRSLPEHNFEAYADKWGQDPSIGILFGQDRLRRSQGGLPEVSFSPNLFSAETYALSGPVSEISNQGAAVDTASILPGDPSEIVLGVLLPFSGKYAEHAARVREGVELAVAELAAADPSMSAQLENGARVRIVYGDTKGEGEIAAAEYRRLVSVEHASAVIGPLLVKDTERVAAEASTLGVPFITFTKQAQVPGLGRPGFRLGATIENQASELAGYATKQLGLRRMAIAIPATPAGRDFSSACRAAVARSGAGAGAIIGEVEYTNGDESSIGAAIDALSKLSPDGVFIPDSLENSIPLLDAARLAGIKPVFLGTALWDDAVTIRGYGKLIDGAVYVTPFFSQSSQPATSTFVSGYRSKFGHEPDLLSAQSYDATHYILRGLEKSGKPISPSFSQALTKNLLSADSFEGATGKISVQKNGDLNRRMSVLRLYNGEAVEVMAGGETKGFIPDGEEVPAQNRQG